MKVCFTIILALLLSCAAHLNAQNLNIGVRQGVGVWFNKNGIGANSLKFAEGSHFSWNKELFVRQNFSNRWAYETSIITYNINSGNTIRRSYETLHKDFTATYIEAPVTLQYDMTYPLAGYIFPRLASMKSYVGFMFAPRVSFEQIVYRTINSDLSETSDHKKTNNVSFFVGFSYTHVVPITKRLALTSVFSFKMKPFDHYFDKKGDDFTEPNRQVAIHTGLSYTL